MTGPPTADPDWPALAALFDEALDLTAAQRAELLGKVRRDRPDLAARLEGLLRTQQAPGHSLQQGGAAPGVPSRGGHRTGDRVGPYRLLHAIGHGGMGDVWCAEREQDSLQQRVAIKFISLPDAAELHRRFLRERAVLARLSHRNIARFLDAGELPDGRPWLAVEYVDGCSISEWCAQHAPSPQQRVRCFLAVLAALDHAHRLLVVHRDLKPGNVLVDADGEVKLLDFGIAKQLDLDDLLTRTQAPMTPRYAAPEQLRGEPISTAADIYGAGVLLFELLSGRLPYGEAISGPALLAAIDTGPPDSLLRAIERSRRQNATAPLYPLAPRALRRLLQGELQQICARALAKDPQERYLSAHAFGEDLRAWLEGRPLLSRPTPLRRRIWKFWLRHRVATSAAALTVVAVLAGTAATLWQAQRATQEAARAEAARRFLSDVFAAGDPFRHEGQPPDLAQIISAGAARLRQDKTLGPEMRARLLHDLGRVQLGLDQRQAALDLLSEAAMLGAAGALNGPERLRLDLDRAEALLALDRAADAESLLGPATADSATHGYIEDEALRALLLHSSALRALERFEQAEALIAPRLTSVQAGKDGEDLARLALEGAWIALRRGRHAEAMQRLESAGASLPGSAPLALRSEFATARVETLRQLNRQNEAITAQREALADLESALGPDHSRSLHARLMLAGQLIYSGQLAAAESEYAAVVPRLERAAVQDSLKAEAKLGRASARWRMGRFAEAEADFRAAEQAFLASLGADSRRALAAREGALMCAIEQGRAAEAVPALRALVSLLRARDLQDSLPSALNSLALGLLAEGDNAGALEALKESRELGQQLGQFTLWTDVLQARALREGGQIDAAIARLEPIAAHYREQLSPQGGPRRAEVEQELALALMRSGAPDAERIGSLLESVLAQRRAALGDESPLTQRSFQALDAWRVGAATRSRS